MKQKDELQKQAEMTERKLDRAGKLVSGLAGERERWIVTAEVGGGSGMYMHVTCRTHIVVER